MSRNWMAGLLATAAIAAGMAPAMVGAQAMIMDGPRGRPEGGPRPGGPGPAPGPGNPGGPAGRLERSEGRPIFHDRESFPENRPAFRPDHAEAPRPQRPEPGPAPGRPGGPDGGPRDYDRPGPDGPGADRPRPDRGDWRGDRPRDPAGWRTPDDDRRQQEWRQREWRDQAQNQRWRDEERRRREDRDRWGRSFGDWRDQNDQNYGFAERRAWADQWNRSWRRDRRYDWLGWRSLNRGAYHLPRYYSPYGGYGYQRFSSGVILEPMYFGQSYWLDDPYAYRLPPAYGSYRWVRYYNDAVLVDLRSGLVVDIVYDIFW